MKEEKDLDAINIKCQYEFSKEYGMTACVPLSLAASGSFVSSCEGDIPCTVSMLMLNFLSGQTVTYGDAIHHSGGVLKISPCGFLPYDLAGSPCAVRGFPEGIGFTGLLNSFVMKPGKVTFLRLVEDVGTYHILYGTGTGLSSSKLRGGYMPSLDVALDGDMDTLIKNYSGQHFALCYGDLSSEIEALARILKIQTVSGST
jgi:L-fucose isomerase-like protein